MRIPSPPYVKVCIITVILSDAEAKRTHKAYDEQMFTYGLGAPPLQDRIDLSHVSGSVCRHRKFLALTNLEIQDGCLN